MRARRCAILLKKSSTVAQPETISPPVFDVMLAIPEGSKLERERRAFQRLLPGLLATHGGQYVAIHDGQVVDAGSSRLDVAMRVLNRIGNVDIFVGLVSVEPEPVARSGVRRDLSR